MNRADQLIVLHHTKFSEHSLVLHCLSRNSGRKSFLLRSVASPGRGAGVSMACLQPLSVLDAEVTDSPRVRLQTVRNLLPAENQDSIRRNFGRNASTMFLSEVLLRSLREELPDEPLFDWCRTQIRLLGELDGGAAANFHLCFLTGLCRRLGFSPDAASVAPFAEGCLEDMNAFLDRDLPQQLLMPLSGARRTRMARALLRFMEYHLDYPLKINSLDILAQLSAPD